MNTKTLKLLTFLAVFLVATFFAFNLVKAAITFNSPTEGSVISGSYNFSGSTNNTNAIKFEVYIDNTLMCSATNYVNLTGDQQFFSCVGDTTSLSDSASTPLNFTFTYNNSGVISKDSATINITIDNTAPSSVSITTPTSYVNFGSDVEIKCSNSDETSGVNNTILTITKPNGDKITKTSTEETTSVTFTIESGSEKDLNELGTYKVDCTVKDKAGHSASASQKTFTLASMESGPSSGGGGGLAVVTHVLGTITSEPKTTLIKENDKAKFLIKGEEHIATVTDVTENSATITVESTPTTFTLNIGETQKVDFEDDGIYDLSIKLIDIVNGKANLELKALEESYQQPTEQEQPQPEQQPTEQEQPQPEQQPTEQEAKKPSTTVWWIVGIVILIILIAIIYSTTRKKK